MINILRHRNAKKRRSMLRHHLFMNVVHRFVRIDARKGRVLIPVGYYGDFIQYRTYELED